MRTVKRIISIFLILLALRWTTIYDDLRFIKKTWRKIYWQIEEKEAIRRGYPEWAVRFWQTWKGHF